MKAGRELDTLIAEKIMGFRAGPNGWECGSGQGEMLYSYSWSPSRDISAAWEVVEKMYKHPKPVLELFGPQQDYADEKWRARFSRKWWSREDSPYINSSEGDTAPEAICRAALAFFEVKLEVSPD